MASNSMLKDTATLFVPTEENSSGVMVYDVYLLSNIFCRSSSGTKKSRSGTTSDEQVDIFIFDIGSSVTKSGTALDVESTCEKIFHVVRASDFTDECVELGYVVPYNASSLTAPPVLSRKVVQAIRRKAGTHRMWHWEVHAK